jgi:hypothetical protein
MGRGEWEEWRIEEMREYWGDILGRKEYGEEE